MYELKIIGRISVYEGNTLILLQERLCKALKHLDKFSHAHVFYACRNQEAFVMKKRIVKIKEIDEKRGMLLAEGKWTEEADLLDLKPYFPSEDLLRTVSAEASQFSKEDIRLTRCEDKASYEIESIGWIRNVNGRCYLQLEEMPEVKSGYVKVFWWFHKFDSEKYRRITECNPPYENAPRTGVFATRSPVRPNPIAMTVTKITEVDLKQKRIYLNKIESFDKTPCIGVSQYVWEEDCISECAVPRWLAHWPKSFDEREEKKGEITVIDSKLQELLRQSKEESSKNAEASSRKTKEREEQNGIVVMGARENNLKGITVRIPYGKITAVVGVSGSGKSSLVNDTIYAECRRRMEYLNHNRNMLPKPKIESMSGCIPSVIISQDAIRGNSMSTVGTYTNAYDYLRIIYAGAAVRYCPNCGNEIIPLSRECILSLLKRQERAEIYDLAKRRIEGQTLEEKVDTALKQGEGAFYVCISEDYLLLQTKQKCYHCDRLMYELTPQTFSYIDADSRCPVCGGTGKTIEMDEEKLIEHPELSLLEGASSFYGKLKSFKENPNANWMKGQVFGLADAMGEDLSKPWEELSDKFKRIILHGAKEKEVTFCYENKKNGRKGEITRPVEGICEIIDRLYLENPDTKTLDKYMTQVLCKSCEGERLGREGRMAAVEHVRYPQAANMSFDEIAEFCSRLRRKLGRRELEKVENAIASLEEIANAARTLGISYLPLSQETGSMSGGEGQRVKLLGAFMNHMTGILYVFDEPSKGLHPSDYKRVMDMMLHLREEGNTIVMVEHNEDMIRIADYIMEMGPGAGKQGGQLVREGTLPEMLAQAETQISKYMSPYKRKAAGQLSLITMENLKYRNLKNISVTFPENAFTCICGVSGSGKSSLMKGEIYRTVNKKEKFSDVVLVDQLPIGKNSKSITATYIGIMDEIRNTFAVVMQAVKMGFTENHFSFNGEAGQCPACKGEGRIKLKYPEDTYVSCPDCRGARYQKKILEVLYKEKNISEVLEMSIEEAVLFWAEVPDIVARLSTLQKVGLGYLKLGQNTSSLSGGEASRLKLAKELLAPKRNHILYLLDEPTTGLHFSDTEHLLELIYELVQNDNTVIAVEHNKQFIGCCDWLIGLGPGAGKAGGEVIRQGYLKH